MKNPLDRKNKFEKWWRNHRRHSKAHHWMTKTATDYAYRYFAQPQLLEEVKFINKRFTNSTHKKLNKSEAYKLWKVLNPTITEKVTQLHAACDRMQEIKAERKREMKAENQPTITVKKRRKFTLQNK